MVVIEPLGLKHASNSNLIKHTALNDYEWLPDAGGIVFIIVLNKGLAQEQKNYEDTSRSFLVVK